MKPHHFLLTGSVLVILGYGYYWHKNVNKIGDSVRSALTGNFQQYSNMNRIEPNYVSVDSVDGESFFGSNYQPNKNMNVPTNWSLGRNGGDGSQINAGWTNFADTYSARVSTFWKQEEALEARL